MKALHLMKALMKALQLMKALMKVLQLMKAITYAAAMDAISATSAFSATADTSQKVPHQCGNGKATRVWSEESLRR